MNSKYLLIAIPVLLISIVSCKKKSDDDGSKAAALTEKAWKYKSAGVDLDKNGSIDQSLPSGTMQPCMLDNLYTFKSDNTGTIDEGGTKCNTTDPQTTPFNWNFTDNQTSIFLQSSALFGLGGKFRVITLNSTQFSMAKDTTYTVPGYPGLAVAIVINLEH
jgi:hypothetical protein